MSAISVVLIIVGFVAIVWGLPAAHRLKRPWDILAAILFLSGLASSLLGTLLLVVPGFFG